MKTVYKLLISLFLFLGVLGNVNAQESNDKEWLPFFKLPGLAGFYGTIDSIQRPILIYMREGVVKPDTMILNLYVNFKQNSWYQRFELYQVGSKVYRSGGRYEGESVVYDFGLNEGDEFIWPNGSKFRVVRTRDTTIFADTLVRRALDLINIENPKQTDTWVEGLGSVHTGFLLPDDMPECTIKEFFYTYDPWFSKPPTIYNLFDRDDLKTLIMFEAKKNDEPDKPVDFEFIGDTLYVQGSQRTTARARGFYMSCLVHGDSIEVYADLFEGTTYGTADYLFEAKFTGFKPGTYRVRYNLNDYYPGGVENRVEKVITCGPTAIRGVETKANASADVVYDMSGRRLNETPKQGFYIRGKKKYYQK